MGKKTLKELNLEIIELNRNHEKEVTDLKKKHNDLKEAFEELSRKYANGVDDQSVKNAEAKCHECGENFSNSRDLKNHVKKHIPLVPIKCTKCERMFDKEWKMNAHLKTHKMHACENCDKTFKYKDILEKHIKIAHGDIKLYCHFFNNEKQCPFQDKCIFLHENSSQCKYGNLCERTNCMHRHLVNEDVDGDEQIEQEEVISDDDCDMGDLDDESGVCEAEKTFFNPSAVTEVKTILQVETEELKCELCVFKTNDKTRFTKHMKEIHSVTGKYVCTRCERQFESRKEFNGHKYHGCGGWMDRMISKS